MQQFYRDIGLHFARLGGSRPDAAVAVCAMVSLYMERLSPLDIVLAPDVLAATLAALCAPLTIANARELRGQDAFFQSPSVSVCLKSNDLSVCNELRKKSDFTTLSLVIKLDPVVTMLPNNFRSWNSLTEVDLKHTTIQCIGHGFAAACPRLTNVVLPDSVTEIEASSFASCLSLQSLNLENNTALRTLGPGFACDCPRLTSVILPVSVTEVCGSFLNSCESLTCIDLRNTAIQTIGACFVSHCPSLTAVALPDTVTEIGDKFLSDCTALQHVDLNNTSLLRVPARFAFQSPKLARLALPNTVTQVGDYFLWACGRVEVVSGSAAVQAASDRRNRPS